MFQLRNTMSSPSFYPHSFDKEAPRPPCFSSSQATLSPTLVHLEELIQIFLQIFDKVGVRDLGKN